METVSSSPPPALIRRLSFCLAASHQQAEDIMHRLELEHFSDDRISVIFPDKGALAVAGLGAFIGAGPLIGTLCAAPGACGRSLAAGLVRLGLPETTAADYQRKVEAGSFLVSVHATTCDEIDHAARIFAELGAGDIYHS